MGDGPGLPESRAGRVGPGSRSPPWRARRVSPPCLALRSLKVCPGGRPCCSGSVKALGGPNFDQVAPQMVDTWRLSGSNKAGDMALASQDGASEAVRADRRESQVRASSPERRGLNLNKLPYLVGPVAFAVIVVLLRFGYVAHVRWWVWLIVLVSVTVINVAVDRIYQARRSRSLSTFGSSAR